MHLKSLEYPQKGNPYKVRAKEGTVIEKISIKNKPDVLCIRTKVKDFTLKREPQDILLKKDYLWKWLVGIQFVVLRHPGI